MADPLSLLREYTLNNRPIQQQENKIIFGNLAADKQALTNFKKSKGGYYTVHSVWFLLQNADKATQQFGQYVREAQAANVPNVALADIKDLLAYCRGEISSTPKLDLTAFTTPAEAFVDTSSRKHGLDDSDRTDSVKRSRLHTEGEDDMSDMSSSTGTSSMDVGTDITKEILKREKLLRTRASILQSNGKNFSKVLDLFKEAKKKQQEQASKTSSTSESADKGKKGYNRYDVQEKDFWKEHLKEDDVFQIDTMGSNLPSNVSRSPSSKQNEETKKDLTPIIVVPAVEDALINLYNVKELLENNRYVPPEIKRKETTKISDSVLVLRKKDDGTSTPYRVIDSISKLRPEDWKRIVAVFAHGPAWQFKGWIWKTPVEIFHNVKGFHLMTEDSKLDNNIKTWDVKLLKINPRKPHLDNTAVREFWLVLDKWIATKDFSYLKL